MEERASPVSFDALEIVDDGNAQTRNGIQDGQDHDVRSERAEEGLQCMFSIESTTPQRLSVSQQQQVHLPDQPGLSSVGHKA